MDVFTGIKFTGMKSKTHVLEACREKDLTWSS